MSETQLTAKIPQPHPKQSIPVSYPKLTLNPYSQALELQFAPNPFYTFVSLDLIVLYQLESLNLDDYNLTYSQNKKGVLKIFDNNSFETSSFPLHKNSSKPNQTNQNNAKQPQTELKPSKNTLHKARVFLQTQTQENRGSGFGFLPLNLFLSLLSSSFFFLIT